MPLNSPSVNLAENSGNHDGAEIVQSNNNSIDIRYAATVHVGHMGIKRRSNDINFSIFLRLWYTI